MSADEINRQIEELESLKSQTQRWRLFAVISILLILGCAVGVLVNDAASLAREGPRREAFVETFEDGLKKEIVPSLERIGKQTIAQIKPAIETELKKLNERAPEIGDAFLKELDLLSLNIRREGTKAVYDSVGEMLKKREARIRQMYPEVTDEKVAALANNLVEQANENVVELSDRLFAEHIKALGSITESIHEIQRTEKLAGDEDLPTWEMAMLVVDLVREEMKDLDTTEPAPAKGPGRKETKP